MSQSMEERIRSNPGSRNDAAPHDINTDIWRMQQTAQQMFGDDRKEKFTENTLSYIDEMVKYGHPTKETITKEYLTAFKSRANASIGFLGATYAAGAGVPGANILLEKYGAQIAEYTALMDMIESNPKEYILAKAAANQGRFTAYLQSAAQMASQMGNQSHQYMDSYINGLKIAHALQAPSGPDLDTLIKTLTAVQPLYNAFKKNDENRQVYTNMMSKLINQIAGQVIGTSKPQVFSTVRSN
ncbi:MAG: hypothetical protein WC179_08055 [Candidatus Cloacimonadaceae bacterium]